MNPDFGGYRSIEGLAESFQPNGQDKEGKQRDRPDFGGNFRQAVAFQQNSANDTQEVGQGKDHAYVLGPRPACPGRGT